MKLDFFDKYFDDVNEAIVSANHSELIMIGDVIEEANARGAKLVVAGNGGSAAMASHVTVDFTKTAGIRAVNFNEADLITCFANDYGYENWIVEALKSYADQSDIIILISSSGMSKNLVNAANYCRKQDLMLITLTGFSAGNDLRQMGSYNLWVDSNSYNIVEMTHHIWLLAILDYIIEKRRL